MIFIENATKSCSYLYFYENGTRYCTQSCSVINNYNDGSYDWKPDLPVTYPSMANDYQSVTKCTYSGIFFKETDCSSVNAYYDPYSGLITQIDGPIYHYDGAVPLL